MDKDKSFMQRAISLAGEAAERGEVPVGAVLVYGEEVIAENFNRREEFNDATAHAEILVLREAGKKLNTWRLLDTTMYITLEPCSMCAGALVQARVSRLVFGARDPKAGAVVSLYNIPTDSRLNHRLEIEEGVLGEECSELLKDFFHKRRDKNNRGEM